MTARWEWKAGPRRARRAGRDWRERLLARERRMPGADAPVVLTFDDGPDPTYTPAVLDELARLDVRATFFCVGDRVAAHPELVARMVAEGHTVGSHSATHPDLPTLGQRRLVEEVRGGRDALDAALGRRARLFRPPHGDRALRTGAVARGLGLRTWLWSVDPEDWRPGIRAAEIAAGCAHAQAGDVILLHDGLEQPWAPEALDRSATVESLADIVAGVRAKGASFAGLPG